MNRFLLRFIFCICLSFGALCAVVATEEPGRQTSDVSTKNLMALRSNEVVFIDGGLADLSTLVTGVRPGIEVVVLNSNTDGLAQMEAYLANRYNIVAVHLVGHGRPGAFLLGQTVIDASHLARESDQLRSIGHSLAPHAEILIYGCSTGAGIEGAALVAEISRLTGATVAASTDTTGAARLGGNWSLERMTAATTSSLPWRRETIEAYTGLFAAFTDTFSTNPIGGSPVTSFTRTLGGQSFTFTFTSDGDGGDFLYDPANGSGGSASIFPQSGMALNFATTEKITIKRTDNSDFVFTSIFINNSFNGNTSTTVGGYKTGSLVGSAQTLLPNAAGTTLNFSNIVVDEVRITSTDITINFDDFAGNTTVNSAPTVTSSGGTTAFTEGNNVASTPVVVDGGLTTSDSDNATLASSTVSITGNFQSGQDVLAFTNNGSTMGNIAGSYTPGTGVLALTSAGATATLAEWQAALRSITYTNTSNAPNTSSRTISFGVNDGTANSSAATKVVSVTSVNDTPVATASGGTTAFTEGNNVVSTPVVVDSGFTVSDLDSAALASGTVSITGGLQTGEDILAFTNDGSTMGNIAGSYTAGTGVLTLTSSGATATVSQWQAALRGITYTNTSNTPNTSNRTISFVVNDGTSGSSAATKTVSVTDVNDAPTITAPGSISVTEDIISALTGISFADLDGSSASETVNLSVASGSIAATSGGGVTVGGTSSALTLAGSLVNINAFIAASNINFTTANNATSNVTLSVDINDNGNTGTGGAQTASTTITLSVTAINDQPTLSATGGSPTYTENGAAVDLFSGVSISTVEAGQTITQLQFTASNLSDGSSELIRADGTDIVLTNGTSGTTAGNTISYSVSVTGSTATVTLFKGGAGLSVANALTVIDNLTYRNSSDTPTAATRTITLTSISDNGGTSNGGVDTTSLSVAATVAVVATNDLPVVTTSGGTTAFTEGNNVASTRVVIDSGVTVSDVDNTTLASATVSITGNLQTSEDVLAFTNDGSTMGNISASYNSGTGVLTLTSAGATATVAQWQAALRAMTYTNTSESPNTSARTISVVVNDGSVDSSAATKAVSISSVNDTPIVTTSGGTTVFTEGNNTTSIPVAIDNNVATSDSDNITLASATVSITGNLQSGEDVLAFTNTGAITYGNISASYNSGTGVLTLTSAGATATVAQWQAALRAVTYTNSSDSPNTSTRTISFAINDGTVSSSASTKSVSVVASNDIPVVTTSGGTTAFTEGNNTTSTPVAIDSGVTTSDSDNTTLASATVSITGNFQSSEDVLAFTNTSAITYGNIASSYNGSSGVLTLTSSGATATVAQWQAALRATTYTNTSESPNTSNRTISVVVNDGSADSSAATKTVSLSSVNDTPVVTTSGGTTAFTEGNNTTSIPVAIDSGATVSDGDNATLASATISITGNFQSSEDVLAFINTSAITYGNISASYNAGTGVLTLTSSGATATVAQWQAALRATIYTNTSESPNTSNRTISFVVNDGTVGSSAATKAVSLSSVNDTPVVTTSGGTTSFTEAANTTSTPVVIDNGVTASDLDNTTLASATVSITGNLQNSEDVLAFTNNGSTMGNISASYNSGTGVLTLTSAGATATVTQWQAALRAVTYTNSSNSPNTSNRTISFVVNDGTTNSGASTKTVSVTATNDVPTDIMLSAASVNQSGGVNATIGTLSTTDADDSSFTYTLVNGAGSADNASFNISGATLRANDASILAAGTYSVRIRTSDSGSATFEKPFTLTVVDDAAPAAPSTPDLAAASDSGSSNTDNITNVTMPTFTGTAEANSTVQLFRGGSISLGTTTANGSGNWSLTLGTALSAGTYSITAKATDAMSNTSAASGALNITIDTTAPSAPSTPDLATASDSGSSNTDNVTNVTMPTFTGTAEAGSTVQLFRSGSVLLGTTTADGGGNWSITVGSALSDGVYVITAIATDAAGQTGTTSGALNVTIDTVAPAAPACTAITNDTGASNNDQITSDTTLLISGTAEANQTVTVFRNATQIGATTANASGAWTFDYTGTVLAGGTHTFTAVTNDIAGNASSSSAAFFVEIDTVTPTAPVITSMSNDTGASATDRITNDATLVFSGTADASAIITVSRSGVGVIGTTVANGSGAWSFDYTGTALPNGSYIFTAFATDVAGNASAVSADFPVTIDTTAPLIVTQPVGGTYTAGGSFTLSVTATDATTLSYQWYLAGNALADTANRSGSTTALITHTNIGAIGFGGNYTVTMTDLAGNSTTSNVATVIVNKADQTINFPAITNQLTTANPFAISATASSGFAVTFSVVSGPATIGGNIVTLTGAGSVTIRASQAGDLNYNPATADRTFNVTKATATITLGNLAQAYDGTAKSATATTTPSGLTVNFTYNGSSTVPVNAGAYTVAATVVDNLYQGTATGTLTISKVNQTVAFTSVGSVTVNTPVTLNATASSGLAVTFSLVSGNATVSGSTFTANDANPITLRASQAGNGNFNAASADQVVSTITKLSQTITFAALADKSRTATAFSLAATASSSLPVSFTVQSGPAAISGSTLTLTGIPGVVTVVAHQSGNAAYSAAPDVSRNFTVTADYTMPVADGYANSVTGGVGAGSQSYTVTTATEFRTQAESTTTAIITVVGVLNLGTTPVSVKSNKTIQGADGNAALVGNLNLASSVSNVVIRGLNLSNPGTTIVSGAYTDGGDGITITGARNVFVTHCTFFDCADHALKITNGADNITVSWCEFYYTPAQTIHRYSMLIGNAGTEMAALHVSLHHNLWSNGVDQRMPSATYGYAHLYNNVFVTPSNTSGSDARDQAQFLSERNIYIGVNSPLIRTNANTSLAIGRILAVGNVYTGTTGTAPYSGTDTVFTPPYSYEALPTSDVVTVVTANAGNNVGASYTDAAVGSATITGPTSTVPATTTFTLTAVPTGFTAATYQWRLNNIAIAGATSATYTVANAQNTDAGIYTIAIGLASGDMVISKLTTITLSAPPAESGPRIKVNGFGGGAPSGWYFGLLFILALARWGHRSRH